MAAAKNFTGDGCSDLCKEKQPPLPAVPTRLIPVPNWNDHHDWPPPGGMRHLIFHEKSNGFETAFKRVGRRVLVDEAEFFRCVERKNAKRGAD